MGKSYFPWNKLTLFFVEEYAQFYGAMTMNREHMVNMRKDGLPYEEMGYSGPPPNRYNLRSQRSSPVKRTTSVLCPDILFRKLPPVPGTNSNYNTIDRIKKGKVFYNPGWQLACKIILPFS